MIEFQRLLDGDEAAAYLKTTKRHLADLRYKRRIAFVKVGGLVRYDKVDLDRFIRASKTPAA